MINDASDMAVGIEKAAGELSPELTEAAVQAGDMPCGLPALPDAQAGRSVSPTSSTYNTYSAPEQVAAFYSEAAKARGGTVTTAGPPGLAEIQVVLGEEGNCTIVAQAQMSGDTNVQIIRY